MKRRNLFLGALALGLSVHTATVAKTPAQLLTSELAVSSPLNIQSNISDRVTQIIADKLVIDASEVTFDANFKKDLGADSIDLVELIMEFEREFEISIPDEAAEKMQTVGDVIMYLEANVKG